MHMHRSPRRRRRAVQFEEHRLNHDPPPRPVMAMLCKTRRGTVARLSARNMPRFRRRAWPKSRRVAIEHAQHVDQIAAVQQSGVLVKMIFVASIRAVAQTRARRRVRQQRRSPEWRWAHRRRSFASVMFYWGRAIDPLADGCRGERRKLSAASRPCSEPGWPAGPASGLQASARPAHRRSPGRR